MYFLIIIKLTADIIISSRSYEVQQVYPTPFNSELECKAKGEEIKSNRYDYMCLQGIDDLPQSGKAR